MKFFSFGSAEKLCQAAIFGHTKENPLSVQVAEFTKLYGDCIHVQSQISNLAHSGLKIALLLHLAFCTFL